MHTLSDPVTTIKEFTWVFIKASFVTEKNWKQSEHLLVANWLNILYNINIMHNHATLKKQNK